MNSVSDFQLLILRSSGGVTPCALAVLEHWVQVRTHDFTLLLR